MIPDQPLSQGGIAQQRWLAMQAVVKTFALDLDIADQLSLIKFLVNSNTYVMFSLRGEQAIFSFP